nr:hypothetical protein [Tanacetum cinerariifolium]
MAYSDKYKKILDKICIDKMKLDGEMKKEEKEAIIKVKGEALIEKEYRGAFGRDELKNVNRGSTMLNHSKAEPMGPLKDVLCQVGVTTIIAKFLILDMPIEIDTPILVGRGFVYTCDSILNTIKRITSTFDGNFHQTFRAAKTSLNTKESDSDDEEDYRIQRNSFGAPILWEHIMMRPDPHDPNASDNTRRWRKQCFRMLCRHAFSWALLEFEKRLGLYHSEEIEEEGFDVYFQGGPRSDENLNAREYCSSALIYCRALDTTTLRELIDSEGKLIPKVPKPGVPRVDILRPLRASMQDLYERMCSMEIRQGAIERMYYRQSYH